MNCSVRKVISPKGWAEMAIGAGDGLGVNLSGFRQFSQGFFGTGSIITKLTSNGLHLGSVACECHTEIHNFCEHRIHLYDNFDY